MTHQQQQSNTNILVCCNVTAFTSHKENELELSFGLDLTLTLELFKHMDFLSMYTGSITKLLYTWVSEGKIRTKNVNEIRN